MYNKAFTLIESLLVLLISTLFIYSASNLLKFNSNKSIELFESTVIHTQFIALLNHEKQVLEDYNISFNSLGHINEGNSFKFDKKEMVVQLVTGRVYEKGQYLD